MNDKSTNERKSTVSDNNKRRTRLDIMFFILEELGGPAMVEAFKTELLPILRLRQSVYDEISEEEFQFTLSKSRHELPYFAAGLLQAPVGGFTIPGVLPSKPHQRKTSGKDNL